MNVDTYLQQYLEFRDELRGYLFRLLANRADCEDVLQETYIKFSENMDSFRGESSFKTWVYSIATNLAKNILSHQARWREDFQDKGKDLHVQDSTMSEKLYGIWASTPDANFEVRQHLDYCFTCISKTLPLIQQVCLLLKDVYGFKQAEIEATTGLSEGKVKHGIVDARKTMIKLFDNRCALIKKQGVCNQCTALKGFLTSEQSAHQEANQLALVQEAESSDSERLLELRLDIVRSTDPINNTQHDIHIYFLENLPEWAERMSYSDKDKKKDPAQ
ncbi:MAG: RNA polymerase sigma factor [Gammaproteobacteria bacterium]|nr:RNA polymerase sigma factor [Gammaproteobacteria bacterium]